MIDLTGPLGGIIAAAYGAGAVMGFGFAHKTVGKRVAELKEDMRLDKLDCDTRITDLTRRMREVEDRYLNGMERQLVQSRESTVRVLRDGDIIPPLRT